MGGQPEASTDGPVPSLQLTPVDGTTAAVVALGPGASLILGRDASASVTLDHESVSRRHASIAVEGGRWCVRDLGSRHGTFVNDQRIESERPHAIEPGDTLVIGPWRWSVEIVDGSDNGGTKSAGRADDRIAFRREARSGAETFATRPTIFLRLLAGDASAREVSWQEFFDRYAPVIRGFARNAGRSGADLEDVVQDVLLGFFQVSPRFTYDPQRGRFRGYLKRCTLNALRRRRGGAAGGIALSIEDLDPAEDAATEAPWEQAWAAQALERATHEVQARVDAKTFEAFDLYARRGVPAETVAERLGIGVNSVHQAKTRVTKLIRDACDAIRDAEG